MEFSLFHGLAGLVRVFTLVFGANVLGHTAYFFDFSFSKAGQVNRISCFFDLEREQVSPLWQVLLAIVIITLIVSLTWIVLFIFGVIVDSGRSKTADMVYHTIGGFLLIIAGIIWIIVELTTERERPCTEGRICGQRITGCSKLQAAFILLAGILGVLDGCVYLIMAFLVWRST